VKHAKRFGLVLAVALFALVAAIAVAGASGADFDADHGSCPEPPGGGPVLVCPTGYVGMPYQVQIQSEDGSGCEPYVWYEVVNSSLPGGLSMSRSGLISGVPTGAGVGRFWLWNHDLTAADGGPSWCTFDDRSEREFSIPIDPGLRVVNDSLKPVTVGQPYSETLTAQGIDSLNQPAGTDVQATWSVPSGALPPGLTLSPHGVLSGTPTTEGSYQFVVKAQNGTPFATQTYTLAVRKPVVISASLAGPSGRAEVGVPYSVRFSATGGSGTFSWALTGGAVPTGTAFATDGKISGTPSSAGHFSFAVTVTDGEGRTASFEGATAVAPKLTVKTFRLKSATRGRPYAARLAAAGGVQPVKWKVLSGKLPLGVRVASKSGTLQGTPRRIGTFRLTVEARDALGAASRKSLVLVVKA
jgi:large repetitive protein